MCTDASSLGPSNWIPEMLFDIPMAVWHLLQSQEGQETSIFAERRRIVHTQMYMRAKVDKQA
jgi:hypothetical protein